MSVKGSVAIIYSSTAGNRAGTTLRPSTNRWFAERYNVNNARNFNGNNGNLNNNNVNNAIRVQAVTNLLKFRFYISSYDRGTVL